MENFEHKAKQQLDQYESPIDTGKMWAHIDAELRPKQKRRLGWLWRSFGVAAVLSAFLLSRQYQRYQHAIHTNPYEAPNTLAAQEPNQEKSQALSFAGNDATSVASTPEIVPSAMTEAEPTKTNYTKNKRQALAEKAILNERSSQTAPKGTSFHANASELPQIATSAATSEIVTAPSTTTVQQALALLPNMQVPASLTAQTGKATLFAVAASNPATPNTNCYDWSPKPQLYGGVYLGASYPFKSLTAQKKEHEAYADIRKNTESVLESVQGGVFVGVMTPKKIFVEGGFEYNRINERFRTTTTTTDTIARYEVIGWVVNAQGDTTFVRDSVFVSQTTTTGATIYNNFQFYNIPIAVGYEFGSAKSRFRPYLKGGVAINIAMPYKSGFLDNAGNINIFESADKKPDTPYRTRIGAIPFAAVGARMSLNERIDAFGELNYRYHLKNVTLDDYLLQQRYSLLGINLGLSMRF